MTPALSVVAAAERQVEFWLEEQLQAQLNGAGAARAENRIGAADVRSDAAASKSSANRRIVRRGPATLAAVRIGERDSVEQVKEFGPELRREPFLKFETLAYGHVPIPEASIAEDIASGGAERSDRRRNQDGIAQGIAAQGIE